MITEEKIRETKELLKRGTPEGEIREELRTEGYSEEDINKAFIPHKYDMRSWYLFFGIAITLSGLYILLITGNALILILGSLLFIAYVNELKRLKK